MRTRSRPELSRRRYVPPEFAYDRFMRMYVKCIGDKRLGKVPRDLDLKPYRDERDNEVLRRIAAALDKGPMRMGFRAYRVRDRRRRPAKKNSTS
jgi:hypothetical protein